MTLRSMERALLKADLPLLAMCASPVIAAPNILIVKRPSSEESHPINNVKLRRVEGNDLKRLVVGSDMILPMEDGSNEASSFREVFENNGYYENWRGRGSDRGKYRVLEKEVCVSKFIPIIYREIEGIESCFSIYKDKTGEYWRRIGLYAFRKVSFVN